MTLPPDLPLDGRDLTTLYTDSASGPVDAPAQRTWDAVESIGGDLGWYAWSVGWGVRGLADSLVGGPGVRLERPSRKPLQPGDIVDWWQVEAVEPGSLLRLRAETRLPGTAWLEFAVTSAGDQASHLTLTTWFDPDGLAGRLYWLSIKPAHGLVFGGMQRRIAQAAVRSSAVPSSAVPSPEANTGP